MADFCQGIAQAKPILLAIRGNPPSRCPTVPTQEQSQISLEIRDFSQKSGQILPKNGPFWRARPSLQSKIARICLQILAILGCSEGLTRQNRPEMAHSGVSDPRYSSKCQNLHSRFWAFWTVARDWYAKIGPILARSGQLCPESDQLVLAGVSQLKIELCSILSCASHAGS